MPPNFSDLVQQQPNPNTLPPEMGSLGSMSQGQAMGPSSGMPMPAQGQPQGQVISPDQKAELEQLFSQVQNANSKLVSGNLMGKNEMTVAKKQLLSKLFELMQEAGVNPGNPESVKAFLSKLEQEDPDLLAIFEEAFRELQSPDVAAAENSTPSPEGTVAPSGPDLMGGQFQNLQRLSQ